MRTIPPEKEMENEGEMPVHTETKEASIEDLKQRLIDSEVRIQALMLGADAEKVPYIVKLADIRQVEMDTDLKTGTDTIRAAVEKVLQDLPELKGPAPAHTAIHNSGANPGTGTYLSKAEQYRAKISQAKAEGNAREVIAMKLEAANDGIIIN